MVVNIDPVGIDQLILSIDVPSGNYGNLAPAGEGMISYMESVSGQPGPVLHRYDLDKRETTSYLTPVQYYSISSDGNKLLYRSGNRWGVFDTKGSPSIGDGHISTGNIESRIEPAKEWQQIFRESWRIYRDYLYVENHHGGLK